MLAGTQEHCIPCIGICMYHFGFIGVLSLLHPIVSISLPLLVRWYHASVVSEVGYRSLTVFLYYYIIGLRSGILSHREFILD